MDMLTPLGMVQPNPVPYGPAERDERARRDQAAYHSSSNNKRLEANATPQFYFSCIFSTQASKVSSGVLVSQSCVQKRMVREATVI